MVAEAKYLEARWTRLNQLIVQSKKEEVQFLHRRDLAESYDQWVENALPKPN